MPREKRSIDFTPETHEAFKEIVAFIVRLREIEGYKAKVKKEDGDEINFATEKSKALKRKIVIAELFGSTSDEFEKFRNFGTGKMCKESLSEDRRISFNKEVPKVLANVSSLIITLNNRINPLRNEIKLHKIEDNVNYLEKEYPLIEAVFSFWKEKTEKTEVIDEAASQSSPEIVPEVIPEAVPEVVPEVEPKYRSKIEEIYWGKGYTTTCNLYIILDNLYKLMIFYLLNDEKNQKNESKNILRNVFRKHSLNIVGVKFESGATYDWLLPVDKDYCSLVIYLNQKMHAQRTPSRTLG